MNEVHLKVGDSAATMRSACGRSLRDERWTQNPVLVSCQACQDFRYERLFEMLYMAEQTDFGKQS